MGGAAFSGDRVDHRAAVAKGRNGAAAGGDLGGVEGVTIDVDFFLRLGVQSKQRVIGKENTFVSVS